MLTMHDPGFVPHIGSGQLKQARFFEGGAHFGGKDHGERSDRNEELRILRFDPALAIGGKTSRRDEHVNVRMEEHGPRPGV